MKKLVFALSVLAFAAGCATVSQNPDELFPYNDYVKAMEPQAGNPMAAEWQEQNAALIAAETSPAALKQYVASREAADALLAQVKEAYASDPMTLTKIAAVTQLVMCPKCQKAPACRAIWVAALENALVNAKDAYRIQFFRDQLRWCGNRCGGCK